MKPKVSFVVPVYDGDAYLAETLESIRNQSLKDIEIIVIDDCSPDFTPELMEWYIKQDVRIKYHRFEHNKGVQEARNFGNQLAESDLICVCDHDDLCTKHRALYSYHYMNHRPEIDCLTSNYWELNVDGQQINHFYDVPRMTRELFKNNGYVWFHSSACYRKKDILELPYRMVDGETDDYTFLDDWTKAGKKFKTVKKVLANCRRTPWSVMQYRRKMQGLEPSYYL